MVAAAGFLVFLVSASPAVGQTCPIPSSPIVIADPGTRYSTVGGSVTVPIVAVHSDSLVTLTWSATGLPPALQIAPTTGVIAGTLALGSEGSHSVRVTVTGSDGSGNCRDFTWKVSEWLEGDLFAGLSDESGAYAWWSRDGLQLKGSLLVAPGEISAGCASDWRTGDLFTTNFAFVGAGTYRVSGAPSHAAQFFDSDRPAGTGEYRDTAPESVALANNGAFYVGHADGFYTAQRDPISGNPVVPCALVPDCVPADAAGSPLVRGFVLEGSDWTFDESYVWPALDGSNNPIGGVPGELVFDIDHQTLRYSSTAIGHYFVQVTPPAGTQPEIVTPLKVDSGWGISAGGPGQYLIAGSRDAAGVPYWHRPLPAFYSASIPIHPLYAVFPDVQLRPFYERTPGQPILGPDGGLIPARLQDGRDLHVYRPDGHGGYNRSVYDAFVNTKGTDWIDLSSDQRTIFYTSEYGIVHRYDPETGTQLPPFAIVTESSLFALRLLPPGDGTGGLLVATLRHVVRLSGAGRTVMTYQGRETCIEDPNGCPDPEHFAVAVDPDGLRFWTGSYHSGNLYEFDIQSGRRLAGPVPNAAALAGLCTKLEYTAAQEICNDTPPIDDDGDGIVNENCAPLEICSPNVSPGDDDGDGLIDVNDPDCGSDGVPSEVCGDGIDNNNDGRIDEGTCDRLSAERQPVEGVFLLPSYSEAPDRTFADDPLFPLPPGLQLNTQTGQITGTAPCTAVKPLEGSRTWPVRVVMTDSAGSSHLAFDWTVTNVACPPLAAADFYAASEDVPLAVTALAGLLANDGDALSVASYTQPAHGSVTVNPDGSFDYQPNADFWGSDTFTYSVDDGTGLTSSAAVTITVAAVNDAPLAAGDACTTNEDTVLTVPAPGVLANDTDVDSIVLTTVLVSGPGHGTLTLSPDGSFIYTPALDYHGSDSFTYRASDGSATSTAATVAITVLPINDPPVANPDSASTLEGTPVTFAVLGNDTDIDSSTLSVASFTQPLHGSATLNANGTFTYAPTTGYVGGDNFTYAASDSSSTSNITTVTLAVAIRNQPPVCTSAAANPASIWTPNHKFVPISILGVTDLDGDTVTIKVTSIYQDEPTNTDGDGNHTPDGVIRMTPRDPVYQSKASVRAERSGTKKTPGNGRVYMIGFSATDPSGAFCTGVVTVCVPHDQGGRSSCVNDGPLYDSTVTAPKLPSHDEDHCSVPDHDHSKSKGKGGKDDGKDGRNPGSWMMSYWRRR